MMDTTLVKNMEVHPGIKNPGLSKNMTVKECFWISFLSAVQGILTYSIFRCYRKKEKLGCLINKTVGPQYSLWCLPPGISMFQLSALMVCRYLDFDGFIALGSLFVLAEHFVPCGRHVKHTKVVKSDIPCPSRQKHTFSCRRCQNAETPCFLPFPKKKQQKKL